MYKPKRVSAKSTLVLLVAITLLVGLANIYALTIRLDGSEDDWICSGWISPYGNSCGVPSSPTQGSVWLCCNTTSIPRECQLLWYDGVGKVPGGHTDLNYTRLYTNSSGVYALIRFDPPRANQTYNITLTLSTSSEFNLTIVIDIAKNGTITGYRYYFNNVRMSGGYINATGGQGFIEVSVTDPSIITSIPNQVEIKIGVSGVQSDSVDKPQNVVVYIDQSNHIAGGSYDNNHPIPVPEPWFTASAVLAVALLTILTYRKR